MDTSAPQLDLTFARRQHLTVLERRLFRWPFALTRTFALDRAAPHLLSVFLQTSSGAVHGEDSLRQRLLLRRGAAAYVTTQGASAIHRAGLGQTAQEHVAIVAEADAHLDYLPEPRILFPDAALEQHTTIECHPTAFVLAADAFTLHDPAGVGRAFRRFLSTVTLRRPGWAEAPLLVDRQDVRPPLRGRTRSFAAFGSIYVLAPDIHAGLMAAVTTELATIPGVYGAASELPGAAHGFSVRLAAPDLRAVRAAIAAIWRLSRQARLGHAPSGRGKGLDMEGTTTLVRTV